MTIFAQNDKGEITTWERKIRYRYFLFQVNFGMGKPPHPHRAPSSPYLQKGLERGTVKAKSVKGQSREVFKRGNLSLWNQTSTA